MKFCSKCGNKIEPNQKFCGNCGFDLSSGQQSPPVYTTNDPAYEQSQHLMNQQQPFQPQTAQKKSGKGLLIGLILIVIIAAAGFSAFKMDLIPGLPSIDLPGTDKPVQISNIQFAMDPADQATVGTFFNNVTSITVLAELNNVKEIVSVEFLWLYEDDEILVDTLQYQAGDWIEYTIETADGGFFDIGSYSVIFYIDGVAVANASFDIT